EVVLTLKASGVTDVKRFRWLEAPEARALERAELLLADLGAINGTSGAITPLGRRMLAFPAHPRYARMLLGAQEYGCVKTAALIAALTQGRDLLLRGQSNRTPDHEDDDEQSDFFRLIRLWQKAQRNGFDIEGCRQIGVNAQAARQVAPLYEQFLRIAAEEGLEVREKPVDNAAVQRCLLVAFPDHLAKRIDGQRCELVHGRRGVLARDSTVKAPLFVAAEIREVESGPSKERNLNVILSLATAVREEWLHETLPDGFNEK